MADPWVPTKAIVTARAIPDNLLAYTTNAARQAAALKWAGGNNLKLIRTVSNSLAEPAKPIYPSIAFSDDNDLADYTELVVPGAYSGVFELSIQNRDADTAVTQARIYDKAFKSMIRNCPSDILLTNTGAMDAILNTLESGFERIKGHTKRKNDFLQQFQIRFTYTLKALTVS